MYFDINISYIFHISPSQVHKYTILASLVYLMYEVIILEKVLGTSSSFAFLYYTFAVVSFLLEKLLFAHFQLTFFPESKDVILVITENEKYSCIEIILSTSPPFHVAC
jgi:hypothetical protein